MNEKRQWVNNKGSFSYGELPEIYDQLPPAVYELNFDAFKSSFFLEKIGNQFQMPERIYELEIELIDRIITTFQKLDKNFGVLLKGLKGTGKTIVAKLVCNQLKLPVILITRPYNDIANFISTIDQNIILMFDEFEKIYEFYPMRAVEDEEPTEPGSKHSIHNLLMLMDGVFTSKYKRLFILTTNKDYLPDPVIARPSRIRYVKDFSDLSHKAIMAVLNDMVKNKKLIPGLVSLLKGLEIITVDIVKSIAEEANLYDTDDPKFFSIFNIKRQEHHYDLYEIKKNKKEELAYSNEVIDMDELSKGNWLHVEDRQTILGRLVDVDKIKCLITVLPQSEVEEVGPRGKRKRIVPPARVFRYAKTAVPHHVFLDM